MLTNPSQYSPTAQLFSAPLIKESNLNTCLFIMVKKRFHFLEI